MAFLQTSGTKFTLDGQPFYLFGCTMYNYLYWFTDPSGYQQKIASIADAGFNTIRFTNYMNVAEDLEYASYVWERIDAVLDVCRQYNLKVIIEHSEISGIADFKGAKDSAAYLAVWQNFFAWLPNRVNTVNGRVYKNDDTIAMYSIAGELGEPFGEPVGNRGWYTTLSGYIRANDTNHLITPGAMNPEQIWDSNYAKHPLFHQTDILTVSSVDVAATEGYYDAYIGGLYPQLKSYTQAKGKPWINIEFGYDQANHSHKGDAQRAKDLRYVMDTGLKNDCAGVIFWNYDDGVGSGYGVSPSTPESWQMLKTYAKTTGYTPRLRVT